VKAGELRHRLTLQRKTEGQDTFGAVQEQWTDDFTVWGAFEPIGSRLFPVAMRRFAEATAMFRIRFMPGVVIDPDKHRIVFTFDPTASPQQSTAWTIFTPMPVDGKRFELHIEAREYE
jgi:head-tail adaptor